MTHSPLPSFLSILRSLFPRRIEKSKVTKYWHKNGESAVLLSKTAWAIATIAQLRKKEKQDGVVNVWIPGYFCNASLSILRKTGAKITFYPILDNLEPDYSSFKELILQNGTPDIFLLVHYFGKPALASRAVEFCSKNGAWLVEDAAHVLRPVKGIGEAGDFVMFSPHKLLPLPDGAILVVRQDGPSSIQQTLIEEYFQKNKWSEIAAEISGMLNEIKQKTSDFSALIWLIKKVLQKCMIRTYVKQPFYDEQTFADDSFVLSPSISKISLRLLFGICNNLSVIAILRERNQLLWDYILEKIIKKEKLSIEFANRPLDLNWTPYLSAYKGEELAIAGLYNRLETKLFLPTTWPDLPPEVQNDNVHQEIAKRLRNTIFFLPVHQTIPQKQFKKIVDESVSFEIPEKIDIRAEWNKTNKKEWNELINKKGKSNLLQIWSYGEAKSKVEGWIPNRVIYYNGERIIAIVQILEKKIAKIVTVYRVNRGPIFFTDDVNIRNGVINHLLSTGNIFTGKILSVSLELENKKEILIQLLRSKLKILDPKGYTSIWVDMNVQLDEIRKSLNGKWRNMLVYAEKKSLQVESGSGMEMINWLCEVHNENMSIKGFKGISSELLKSLAMEEDAENPVMIYKASFDGKPVAAVCVAYHGKSATYLIGWTSEEGRRLKANYLLLWEAIKDLKKINKKWFDLGGIDAEATPGITGFKTGMNGELYTTVPSGWCVNI